MSDLMLHGVLNMPLPDDPTECDLVTWVQFKDRAAEASQRIEKLEAVIGRQHKQAETLAEGWRISDDARIELEAKLAKAVEALEQIASHRKKCHEYDDDVGHERREFDVEDMIIMEYAARTTLAELKGQDDE